MCRHDRPVAVTVISYILLACAPLELWYVAEIFQDRTEGWNDPVFMTYAVVSPVLHAVCGFFMLRGANWARILVFAACLPMLVYLFFTMDLATALGVMPRFVVAGLVSTRLLSRSANRFFTDRDTIFFRKAVQQPGKVEARPRDGSYDY